MKPLIETRDLNFSYRIDDYRFHALKDICLTIAPGELVGVVGASGSGKSTLLYVLGGLMRPDSGFLSFAGKETSLLSNSQLAFMRNHHIGFVFQQFHLLPRFNVLDNVMLPCIYQQDKSPQARQRNETKALDLIEKLGLTSVISHLPNQLSGGQQQRVAIARALMGDTRILFADEPTGNLDSENSTQVLNILKGLHSQGTSVVIITHNPEIAQQCQTVYSMKDGLLRSTEKSSQKPTSHYAEVATPPIETPGKSALIRKNWEMVKWLAPLSIHNLRTNKVRSILTMIGITIGIAGVLAMLTLGSFTKSTILQTYEALGVNKLVIFGNRNWQLSAADRVGSFFQGFNWERDLLTLFRIFPETERMSPVMRTNPESINFSGKTMNDDLILMGVNADYIHITNRKLLIGRPFSPFHIRNHSAVCLIGYDIAKRLFTASPLGSLVSIKNARSNQSFSCRVSGVFAPQTTNNDWEKPNTEIHIPYTFFPFVTQHWESRIRQAALTVAPKTDVEKTSKGIKAYLQKKYGRSGMFRADASALLIEQLKKFINVFSILLTGIALMSLLVGGMGITNMMLISVVERFKEIGLRKALGATDISIRTQFLLESIIVCFFAGLIGLVVGFFTYEAIIFAGSKVFPKTLKFAWTVEPGALSLSIVAIFVVGLLSGLFPAFKAERLSVIEALRSE